VTSAEANEWTGNILILFNPRQTSEELLCAGLRARCRNRPASEPLRTPRAAIPAVVEKGARLPNVGALAARQRDPQPAKRAGYLTGWRRRLYRFLGWSSVGMAVVGAVTPGIPTAPFVILAGYFFIRSSPAAHIWLLRSRWFGPFLRDWEERHGVRRSVKYTAVGLMGAGLAFSVLVGLPVPVVASIVALEVIGLVVVLRLPVVEAAPTGPSLAGSKP
jgi:uncharacterized membrane protein YbaN (DUF454 family)